MARLRTTEAGAGFEPAYRALQALAWPLGYPAVGPIIPQCSLLEHPFKHGSRRRKGTPRREIEQDELGVVETCVLDRFKDIPSGMTSAGNMWPHKVSEALPDRVYRGTRRDVFDRDQRATRPEDPLHFSQRSMQVPNLSLIHI